jgi:hypothetical protein
MMRSIIIPVMLLITTAVAYSETNVGKIIQAANDVDITSLTTGQKFLPEIGFYVNTDHKIRTGKRSYVEILLNNGTRVQMKEVSVMNVASLKTRDSEQPTRIRLLTGAVRISLKKLFRDGHALILKTPTAIAGVRGTDFGAIASLVETKVIVFDGLVDIASSDNTILNSFQLKAKEESDIKKGQAPTRPREVPDNLMDSWFDHYEIDEHNNIIRKKTGSGGFIDNILRKRQY